MTRTTKAAATTKKAATVADLRRITDRQTTHLLAVLSQSPSSAPAERAQFARLAIGSKLPGGIFAGITYVDGRPHVLVLGPEYDGECTWTEFQAWLKTLSVDGCSDFVCPSKLDGMLLWANLRKEFKQAWYWLEQHAEYSDYAWIQYFDSGGQYYWSKGYRLRCRSVRRFPLTDLAL